MASNSYKVESGLQLLARLTKKRDIQNFYPMLFEVAPKLGDVIEILGESNSGKSYLLMDMIAEALVPSEEDGAEIAILVFNTDGNLNPHMIISLLKAKILNHQNVLATTVADINNVIQKCLGRLHYVEIHDATQFYITIQNLETILFDNPRISLFAFDTLTAYYWSEQGYKLTKMDVYVRNIVKLIQKATHNNSTIIYTKPLYFNTSKDVVENPDHLNYRIQLISQIDASNTDNVSYEASFSNSDSQVRRTFKIVNNEVRWA